MLGGDPIESHRANRRSLVAPSSPIPTPYLWASVPAFPCPDAGSRRSRRRHAGLGLACAAVISLGAEPVHGQARDCADVPQTRGLNDVAYFAAATSDRLMPEAAERGQGKPAVRMWDEPTRASARPYVLAGAIVGAAAMVLGLNLALRDSDMMTPLALVPAVLGSAALGALGGWIVYKIRH
jgi:hypothetical protein